MHVFEVSVNVLNVPILRCLLWCLTLLEVVFLLLMLAALCLLLHRVVPTR